MRAKKNKSATPRKMKLHKRAYVFEVLNNSEFLVYEALVYPRRVYPRTLARLSLDGLTEGTAIFVRKSYGDLCQATKLPKRTVQRAIARLIEKQFMQLDRKAGHSKRNCALYKVFDEAYICGTAFAYARTLWYRAGRGCVCVFRPQILRPR